MTTGFNQGKEERKEELRTEGTSVVGESPDQEDRGTGRSGNG